MIYPVYIHMGDATHAHGVTLPDFPGCFSAADSFDDLPARIQEALELHFEGEQIEIPEPSSVEVLERSGLYSGGMWMLVDVDTSRLQGKTIEVVVTLPVAVKRRLDDVASRYKVSASALVGLAAEEFLNAPAERLAKSRALREQVAVRKVSAKQIDADKHKGRA
jgi:predicted RNase H-like HicB family nuclease